MVTPLVWLWAKLRILELEPTIDKGSQHVILIVLDHININFM